MTISVSINSDFHRGLCPRENDLGYENCSDREIPLDYRCSKCVVRCLKCEASRLNTNSLYARGCREARLVATRTFSCICVRDCEV